MLKEKTKTTHTTRPQSDAINKSQHAPRGRRAEVGRRAVRARRAECVIGDRGRAKRARLAHKEARRALALRAIGAGRARVGRAVNLSTKDKGEKQKKRRE